MADCPFCLRLKSKLFYFPKRDCGGAGDGKLTIAVASSGWDKIQRRTPKVQHGKEDSVVVEYRARR
jgi:hypothetical protein